MLHLAELLILEIKMELLNFLEHGHTFFIISP